MQGHKIAEAYAEIKTSGLSNISQSLANVTTNIGSVGGKLENLGTPISGLTSKLSELTGGISASSVAFAGLTAAAGAAAVAIGIKATQAASKLSDSLAEVSTLVDTSTVSMRDFSDGVIDMSTDVYKSSTQLSNGLYQVISAGVDTADSLGVLRVAAKSATAGLSDTFTSVDLLTNFLNAYNLESSETQKVSDLLFATIKEGKTRFGELAGSLGRILPLAAQLNVPIKELLGSIAQLTKSGLSTAESVTAIRSAFMGFMNPAESANELLAGQEELLSANAIKSKGFIQALQDLTVATGGDEEALTKLLGRQEAVLAATGLVGKQMNNTRQTIEGVADSAGETDRAFEKMTKTLSAQIRKFKLEVDKTLTSIGMKLLPAVTDAFKGLNTVIGALTSSPIERIERSVNQLTEETRKQWQETEQLDGQLSKLMTQYRNIKSAMDDSSTSASENEKYQRQLRKVMSKIANIVPEAATELGKYGEVLNINTQAVEDFVKAQKKMTIEDTIKNIKKVQGKIQDLEETAKKLRRAAKGASDTPYIPSSVLGAAAATGKNLQEIRKQLKEAGVTAEGLQGQLEAVWEDLPDDIQKTVRVYKALENMTGDTSDATNQLLKDVISEGWADSAKQARDYLEVLAKISSKVKADVYGPTLAEIKPETGKKFAPPEIPEAKPRKIVTEEEGVKEISEAQKKREANALKQAEVIAGVENQIQKAQKETAIAGMQLEGQELKAGIQKLKNELAQKKAAADKEVEDYKVAQQLKAEWDAVYQEKRMQLIEEHHQKATTIIKEEEEKTHEKYESEIADSEDAAKTITKDRNKRKKTIGKIEGKITDIQEKQNIDRLKASGKMFDARIAEIEKFYDDWEDELEEMHKDGILSTKQYKKAVTKIHELLTNDIANEYEKMGQDINGTIDEIEEGMEDWGEESSKSQGLIEDLKVSSVDDLNEIAQGMRSIGDAMSSAGNIIHGESENIGEDMNNIVSAIDPVAGTLFSGFQALGRGITNLIVSEDERQEAQQALTELQEQYAYITEAFPEEEFRATQIYTTLQVGQEPDIVDMSWWEDKAQEAKQILSDADIGEAIGTTQPEITPTVNIAPLVDTVGVHLESAIKNGWNRGWENVDINKIGESIAQSEVAKAFSDAFIQGEPFQDALKTITQFSVRKGGEGESTFAEVETAMADIQDMTSGWIQHIKGQPSLQRMFAAGGEEAKAPETEQIAAEDVEPSITGGVNVSMITGPTRDIFVKLLSPLKQLNTTFPAMLDVLKDIRTLLGGEVELPKVDIGGLELPQVEAEGIQLPVSADMTEFDAQTKSSFTTAKTGGVGVADFLSGIFATTDFQTDSITGQFKNAFGGIKISGSQLKTNLLDTLQGMEPTDLPIGEVFSEVFGDITLDADTLKSNLISTLSGLEPQPVSLKQVFTTAFGNIELEGTTLKQNLITTLQEIKPEDMNIEEVFSLAFGNVWTDGEILKTEMLKTLNSIQPNTEQFEEIFGTSFTNVETDGIALKNTLIETLKNTDPPELTMENVFSAAFGSIEEGASVLQEFLINTLQNTQPQQENMTLEQVFDTAFSNIKTGGQTLKDTLITTLEETSVQDIPLEDAFSLTFGNIDAGGTALKNSLIATLQDTEPEDLALDTVFKENFAQIIFDSIGTKSVVTNALGGISPDVSHLSKSFGNTFDSIGQLSIDTQVNVQNLLSGTKPNLSGMKSIFATTFNEVRDNGIGTQVNIQSLLSNIKPSTGGLKSLFSTAFGDVEDGGIGLQVNIENVLGNVTVDTSGLEKDFDGAFTRIKKRSKKTANISGREMSKVRADIDSISRLFVEKVRPTEVNTEGIKAISKKRRDSNENSTEQGINVNGNIEVSVQEVSDLTPDEINKQLQEQVVKSRRSIGI